MSNGADRPKVRVDPNGNVVIEFSWAQRHGVLRDGDEASAAVDAHGNVVSLKMGPGLIGMILNCVRDTLQNGEQP